MLACVLSIKQNLVMWARWCLIEIRAILYKWSEKTSLIKSTFKLSLTGNEGLILVDIWKKSVPVRKKNKCTGPKVRECHMWEKARHPE